MIRLLVSFRRPLADASAAHRAPFRPTELRGQPLDRNDASTSTRRRDAPSSPPPAQRPEPRLPQRGLREQLGRTRGAAGRLAKAHVELFRAELGDIISEAKRMAVLGAAALGVALLIGMLLFVGGILFLGEWLFGSLGWGVLHGTLIGAGVITALVLKLLGTSSRPIVLGLAVSILVAILVALLHGSNVVHNLFGLATDQVRASLLPNLDPGPGPVLIGVIVGALLIGLVGLLLGARAGGGAGAIGGLIGGALLGALLGLLLATEMPWHVAVALGIAVGALMWPILQLMLARREGLDPAARFQRLYPRETMETVKETRSWLESEWAKRRSRPKTE